MSARGSSSWGSAGRGSSGRGTSGRRPARRGVGGPERLGPDAGYWAWSRRPLHVLALLLPLIIAYEVGSVLYLTDASRGVVETIQARGILGDAFGVFGAVGLHLPAIVLVVVLMCWHVALRDPWRVRGWHVAGMAGESVAWTMPLLIFAILTAPAAPALGSGAVPVEAVFEMPWQARLTLAIGAGLYEELLFRLILMAVIHFLVVDIAGSKDEVGNVVAIIAQAALFALYHDVSHPGGGANLGLMAFYFAAGLYFGVLFLRRGFGIVVAVHALYDVVVLLALAP